MQNKLKLTILLLGSLFFSSAPAIAALPNITNNSKWRIETYDDGARGKFLNPGICVTFTANGAVYGVPTSGTWANSPTWTGYWLQQGDRVSLIGVLNNNVATTFDGFLIDPSSMTGRYSTYPVPFGGGFPVSFGSWSARPDASCP